MRLGAGAELVQMIQAGLEGRGKVELFIHSTSDWACISHPKPSANRDPPP